MLYDILCVPLLEVRRVQHRQISDFVLYLHRKLNYYAYILLKQLHCYGAQVLWMIESPKEPEFQHNSEVQGFVVCKSAIFRKRIILSGADSNCRPIDYMVASIV